MIFPLQSGVPGGTEFLIGILLSLLVLILSIRLTYWVYNDAKERGENAPFWTLAVGGLLFLTFFGGLLALATYIWQRE